MATEIENDGQGEARRIAFNRFQTYSYGPYVPTGMDAHFDPYHEGLPQPGLSWRDMEVVERVALPASPPGRRK